MNHKISGAFKKIFTYGSRLLYLAFMTSQLVVILMFINNEGKFMLKDYNTLFTAGLLVIKMAGLMVVNFTIFLIGTDI